MNKIILSILIISFPIHLFGQMFPESDQYVYNPLVINPAFAGCQDALSVSVMYRNQWVGFKDAPKSYMFTAHLPLDNDRVGLGLIMENNSIGIFRETRLLGNYAYRMNLFNGKLAFGVGFGITLYNIDWNQLAATDQNDIQLINNPYSAALPAFSLGTYYYTKKYFIGISLPLFLSHEIDQLTGNYKISNNFSGYNYFLTGGYYADITPNIKLLPSMLIKYYPNNTPQADINVQLDLRDKFWIGMGYRNKDILVGMLQCQLNTQLKVAYSYDFNFGQIGKYTYGSHEIVLNYLFSYSRKVRGPRQY